MLKSFSISNPIDICVVVTDFFVTAVFVAGVTAAIFVPATGANIAVVVVVFIVVIVVVVDEEAEGGGEG